MHFNIQLKVLILLNIFFFAKEVKSQKWQDLPLKCHSCENEETCRNLEPKECPENEDTCVTVFNESGKVMKRGCHSNICNGNCENTNKTYYECKSNECNVAQSETDYIKCFKCSSFNNTNCVTGKVDETLSCFKRCMTTLKRVDELSNNKFEVVRGCLDDKEKEDQKKCTSGNELGHCKSCETHNCNNGLFPENRLSCYNCEGKNCRTQPKPAFCKIYQENDQCMIQFDDKGVKVKFGCQSDLNENERVNLYLDNKLYLCKENNCNLIEKLPEETTCIKCSSNESKNCITNVLSDRLETGICKLPITKCYTKYDESTGLVERGCWSEISNREERAKCINMSSPSIKLLSNQAINCELCNGNQCNKQKLPADRKSCFVCNSEFDSNCHDNPKENERPCFNYNDTCATKYVDSLTSRGCAEDLESCKNLDRHSCRLCSEENCNTINLKSTTKDNKYRGMWQDLPLTCNLCENENDCSSLKKFNKTICSSVLDECITIFKNDKVVYRGCSSILLEDTDKRLYCDTNLDLCPECKSNNCNIATSKKDYINCYYCGGPASKACNEKIIQEDNLKSRECYKSCITTTYKHSEENENNNQIYNVIRTCMDDMPKLQQNNCRSIGKDKCKACEYNFCNSELLFENWSSCYVCDSVEKCKHPELKLCNSYAETEMCYYLYNIKNDIIQGGCISALHQDQRLNLAKNNQIFLCRGTKCNQPFPKIQSCVSCDSSKEDDCASEPNNVNSFQNCSIPNSNCYVKLNDDGTNKRGCMNDLKNEVIHCLNNDKCTFCYGKNCNNEIYPNQRQSCFVCDSDNEADCTDNPKNKQICPVYQQDQQCVSKYTNGKTERHCSEKLKCDPKEQNKCKICDEANCNIDNLKKLNGSSIIVANSILVVLSIFLKVYV